MKNNNIFEFLDWVLKKKTQSKEPIDENDITLYMFNRWLSMSDPDIAKIVNLTYNRWLNSESDKNFLTSAKFYRKVLPKITSTFSYIKKSSKIIKKDNDDKQIAKNLEISIREKISYDQLLEDISRPCFSKNLFPES